MSARVTIGNRIISYISIAVIALAVKSASVDFCVGRDKPSDVRIVIPCSVVVESGFAIEFLCGKCIASDLLYCAASARPCSCSR